MGILDYLKLKRIPNVAIIEQNESINSESVGSIEIPDKLTELNAFILANTLTEVYFPIDFIADRASKLKFHIEDSKGNIINNHEYTRFLTNINPFYTFSDIVYQWLFSYYSSGNAISYRKVPSLYDSANIANISRVDVLSPLLLSINEYTNINILDANSTADLIKSAKYDLKQLEIEDLIINQIDATRLTGSNIFSRSPLFKAVRPINNLLATYSARYNVYANNGSAGYLVKKSTGKSSAEEAINPTSREDILKDINTRNGITGRRNFWGISSIPIEFINTLSNIKDLLPFEETLEDSIKIASIFQIPSGLVPRKDQPTYDNASEDEKKVWENTILSGLETCLDSLTTTCMLNTKGLKFVADYSTVSCLKLNEKTIAESDSIKLDNLKKIKEITPTLSNDVDVEVEKILNK